MPTFPAAVLAAVPAFFTPCRAGADPAAGQKVHASPLRVATMPFNTEVKDKPSSVTQLAAAMAALGLYHGENTPAEHAAEARRLRGENAYRVRLANALLGAAQTEAILADTLPISP